MKRCLASLCILALPLVAKKKPSTTEPQQSLDQWVQQVNEKALRTSVTTPGSLFMSNGHLADAVRDVRASQVYDLVTIVVLDNSSAVSTGTTNTQRKSNLAASITSLAGVKSPAGALANLANATNNTQIQGQGTTSRGLRCRPQ